VNEIILNGIKSEVEKSAKELLGDKLLQVVLYGSYATGKYDSESDIDFALIAKISEKEISLYNEKIGEITSKLSINSGILVSVIIISYETFNGYKEILPFYMNLIKEGKVIYG
jgi:uncharacterized protein